MRTIPVGISVAVTSRNIASRVARAVQGAGLHIKTTGTLASYPGSLHWHIVKPGATGTLELTYWPAPKSLWFKVQAGRQSAWIDEVLPGLCRALKRSA